MRHVAGDDRPGADNSLIPDRHAGQNDRSAADPDIPADAHGTPKLQPGAAPCGIAWMIGGINLNGRPDLRAIADGDVRDVKDHTVEVQESARADANVEPVIAEKWGPDNGTGANEAESCF